MSTKAHPRTIAQARYIAEHFNRLAGFGYVEDLGKQSRMDADETNMLALQLEQMRARVYEEEFPELKSRLFIPVTSEIGNGAESFSYKVTTEAGEAKIITNYADDLPSVEVSGRKVTHSIVSVGDSYNYSIQDIRRAAFANVPLSAQKAMAARRAFERKVDQIAAFGAPEEGLPSGFLNHPDVSIEALAAVGAWSTKTPNQILADLNALTVAVIEDSAELYSADRLLLPLQRYNLIAQTRMPAGDGPQTILEAFLMANPTITSVEPWNLLATAGAGNAARMVAYRYSPEIAELVMPQEFEVMPPEPRNLAFVVNCHGRTGGTIIPRPLGVKYMDGI